MISAYHFSQYFKPTKDFNIAVLEIAESYYFQQSTKSFEQLEHQLVDQSSVIDICYATIPQQDSGAKKPSWI
ncbi:hypothetical protein CMV_029395 [Castanea mollissima]|uniref:Uncharacterized protein n=1 Tax=Castanea mollissima TaxID=60419 RepID=A0A8J4Q761_9ROSI|nr:hypothetical protein CMV_029395 [Castanea mollissima]